MNIKRRTWADFLKEHFPFKVQKITINAGFTCPNRDGTKGWGGCTYCNNQTFSPQFASGEKSITQQLEEGIDFFKYKYPEMKYLAYFQSYTNTYGDIQSLLDKYREALSHPQVVGLIIGTRPDCMSNDLLNELKSIAADYFLLIEYGIESTNEDTLKRINRGHTYQEAIDTICRTHNQGIYCGAHLILGLPGENQEEILTHATRISKLPITTIKLHQLQLIRGTRMANEYEQHPDQFHIYTVDEYIDLCVNFLKKLRADIIVERFVSQSPKELLIAPDWGLKNHEFTAKLEQKLRQ